MDFAQKKSAFLKMQGEKYLDADRKLLKEKNAAAPALTTGLVDKAKAQRDVLWDLLDVSGVEEIKQNRGADPLPAQERRTPPKEGEKAKAQPKKTAAPPKKTAQKKRAPKNKKRRNTRK